MIAANKKHKKMAHDDEEAFVSLESSGNSNRQQEQPNGSQHSSRQSVSAPINPAFIGPCQVPVGAVGGPQPPKTPSLLFRPYDVVLNEHQPLPESILVHPLSQSAVAINPNNNQWLPFNMSQYTPSFPNMGISSGLHSAFSSQNMSNISNYLPQLPSNPFPSISANIPRMPSINMPNFNSITNNIPSSLPTFNLPSMPSIPSLPNLNDLMYSQMKMKSWPELKEAVRVAHRRLSEVSSKMPFAFNFRPIFIRDETDGTVHNGVRIYFLCPSNSSSETSLNYLDVYPDMEPNQSAKSPDQPESSYRSSHHRESSISSLQMDIGETASMHSLSPSPSMDSLQQPQEVLTSPKSSSNKSSFEWKQLIEPRFKSSVTSCTLNIEEKLQMERKRMMLSGITSYEFDTKSRRFVFTSGHNLFYFDDDEAISSPDEGWDVDDENEDDENQTTPPYLPTRIETNHKSAKMNPQICPSNSDLIAFAAEGNVYVTCVKSGQEVRLTSYRDDDRVCVSAGLPSYVIQEEFRRYLGFWWRPEDEPNDDHNSNDETNSNSADGSFEKKNVVTYGILYEEVDETRVDIVRISSYDGQIEEYRFPRPGEPNATSSLRLVTFNYDTITGSILESTTGLISGTTTSDFPHIPLPSIHSIYPETEYLTRVGFWGKNIIWIEMLNRKQTLLSLALISVTSAFPPQIIYQEKADKYWINIGEVTQFLQSDQVNNIKIGSELSFIWSSEETGFRHLYKIKVKLVDVPPVDETKQSDHNHRRPLIGSGFGGPSNIQEDHVMECNHQHPTRSPLTKSELIQKIQLTSGNWEISDRDVWIDEKSGLIYFVGLKEIPLERHLYVTCMTPPDDPKYNPIKRLTDSGFSHTFIALDSNTFKYFVNIQSNISVPPFGYVFKIDPTFNPLKDRSAILEASEASVSSPKRKSKDMGHKRSPSLASELLPKFKKLGLVVTNPFISSVVTSPGPSSPIPGAQPSTEATLSIINDSIDLLPGLPKPELFTYQLKSSGDLVYGVIFKPEFMENGVKYPCLLDIYGGPEVQVVSNSFKGVRHVRRHLLASEGYVVCSFDTRGSHHRGKNFEGHIYKKMGQVEIEDQVEVLQWLAENTGYIDMKRIAIHGWSYGGYLSLMALAQRPDIFKISIAGAPVTKWNLYDTGYTERYMDTPYNNTEGYAKGSVLTYVNDFPDNENRLLIIHGLMDENVHFIHSVELINALIKSGKPYNLQVYPSERHSLRNSPCCEHYETLLLSYLQRHL